MPRKFKMKAFVEIRCLTVVSGLVRRAIMITEALESEIETMPCQHDISTPHSPSFSFNQFYV